jgi:hypothetical protein
MTVLITIGKFRLTYRDRIASGMRDVCIEHKCESANAWPMKGWHPFVYGLDYRGISCFACHATPDEGIQAMFWFLKEARD